MEPAIREASSVVQLWRTGVAFLYQHSRVQFHSALYILLYASILTVILTVVVWALNFVLEPQQVVDYRLIGAFTACGAVAELTRAHMKHWLGVPPNEWSFQAMAAGGAALGLTLWVVVLLQRFNPRWYELPLMASAGAIVYLVLGYLFRYEERKKLRKRHDT
jgi:hypothetical protein